MTPQERDLIEGVAASLRSADRSWTDPDAVRLIRERVASLPGAAYLLTQRVIVSELALKQAQARIAALEGQARDGGGSNRGFLGGLFGGGSPPPAPQPAPPAYGPGPGYGPPAGGGGGSAAGGFLKTAAAAAAGTIGGELIYDGMRHLFADGGHGFGLGHASGFVPDAFASGGIPMAQPVEGGAGDRDSADAPPAGNEWNSIDDSAPANVDDGAGDFSHGADAGGDFGDDDTDAGGGDFGDGGDNSGGDW